MRWTTPLAALTATFVAFLVSGSLVGLLDAVLTTVAVMAVVAVVVVLVLATTGFGLAPNRWRSNPYWGR